MTMELERLVKIFFIFYFLLLEIEIEKFGQF